MPTYELDSDTVRRLAELPPSGGRVLSLYLDLDPSQFGTAPARATAIRSLLDEAERRVEDEALEHRERAALREDLAAAREYLERGSLHIGGARGLALFANRAADLFDVVRLPRPTASQVAVDRTLFLEPLLAAQGAGDWCVLLVNRRTARILRGPAERLEEVDSFSDDVHGWHDQGGWSQARYQRGIDKEIHDHLVRTAQALFSHFKRSLFTRLLIGAPPELVREAESRLHPYLADCVAGHLEIDVEHSTVAQVRAAAAPVIEEDERRREREALDRLAAGVGAGGRATAGLGDVTAALNERRVEALLLANGFRAPGTACSTCGWLGTDGLKRCPVDDSPLEQHDDIGERAVEVALAQSADVIFVRHHPDLGPLGNVGALLRF